MRSRVSVAAFLGLGALLAHSCTGESGTKPGPGPGTETDPGTTPSVDTADSAADTGSAAPAWVCWSDVDIDEDRDGTSNGGGLDAYDPDHVTWQLYRERDYNGNGQPEQFARWERDPDGNVLHYEAWGTDPSGYDATYDADGNRLTYDVDEDGDHVVDATYRYGYENGWLVLTESDTDADGIVDNVLRYERDAEGRRLLGLEDTNGDGTDDVRYTYTLDEVGREVLVETDEGIDDVIDAVAAYDYTDELLNVGTATLDDGNDGVIDQAVGFEYDAAGYELYYAFDIAPVDGVWDYERWTTRDASGNILVYRLLTGLYGAPLELVQEFVRDELGRTVALDSVVSDPSTGVIDSEVHYDYVFAGTCP
jgi:hypothetical protein